MYLPDQYSWARIRETTKQWYDGTLYSRLDNKAEDVIIVVMQRLHVDDLVAHLLEKEEWDHLNIPAIAECDQVYEIGPELVHERRVGEALHSEREPLETLEIIMANLGSYNFAAQYQQDPVPAGGGMIKWEWFPRYHELPEQGPRSQIVQSWDTASNLRHFAGFSLTCLARIALARASGFADTLAPTQYRSGASFIGAAVRPRRRR